MFRFFAIFLAGLLPILLVMGQGFPVPTNSASMAASAINSIGVDLLHRSPRGVRLTTEGRLFLQEVRELLKRTDESVEKVRALVRGKYGELRVGYAPIPAVEILPPWIAAFRKSVPRDLPQPDESRRS